MDQPLPSSTPATESARYVPSQSLPAVVHDWISVDFRPMATEGFDRSFGESEKAVVLALLVRDADKAIPLEEGHGRPLMQLTLFSVRFRFWDLRDVGRLLVDSVGDDSDGPPPTPPRKRPLRDAVVSGGVSGAIRWVLGELFGKLMWTQEFVFPESADFWPMRLNGHLVQSRNRVIRGAELLALAAELDRLYCTTNYGKRTARARLTRLSCQTLGVGSTRTSAATDRVSEVSADAVDTCSQLANCDLAGCFAPTHSSELEASWRTEMSAPGDEQRSTHLGSPKRSTRNVDGEVLTSFQVPISRTVDVRAIRKKLGMTQESFSQVFGLSLASLRNWEQGTRIPERPIALYLRLIEKYPEEVRREVDAMRVASSSDA